MIYFCNTEDVNYTFEEETMLYHNERMCEVHFSVNWAKTICFVTFGWLGHNVCAIGTANIIIDLGQWTYLLQKSVHSLMFYNIICRYYWDIIIGILYPNMFISFQIYYNQFL